MYIYINHYMYISMYTYIFAVSTQKSLKTQEIVMILANIRHWLDIFENHFVLVSILSNVLKVCSLLTWLPSHMSFQKILSRWVRSTKMIVASMFSGIVFELRWVGNVSCFENRLKVWIIFLVMKLVLPLVGCCLLCPQVVKLAWISMRGEKLGVKSSKQRFARRGGSMKRRVLWTIIE